MDARYIVELGGLRITEMGIADDRPVEINFLEVPPMRFSKMRRDQVEAVQKLAGRVARQLAELGLEPDANVD